MAARLSQSKIEQMWAAWLEKPSVRYVGRVCDVSRTTAQRYRMLGNWDSRRAEVVRRAEDKQDTKAAERLAGSLKLIQAGKQVYAASLVGKTSVTTTCPKCGAKVACEVPVPKLKPNFRDLKALIEAESHVIGAGGDDSLEPKRVRFPLEPPPED